MSLGENCEGELRMVGRRGDSFPWRFSLAYPRALACEKSHVLGWGVSVSVINIFRSNGLQVCERLEELRNAA